MAYRIELKPSAVRALSSLPKKDQRRISAKIDSLAKNPRPPGAEKIEGRENLYRLRSEDYRILYQVQARLLLILVVKIGHRREIYGRL
jgi:mRNA interferase RelE/StbE